MTSHKPLPPKVILDTSPPKIDNNLPTPESNLPTNVSKSVLLTCKNGVWGAEVKMTDPKLPFTPKDWNQISNLLIHKAMQVRRLAAIEYRRLNGSDKKKELVHAK